MSDDGIRQEDWLARPQEGAAQYAARLLAMDEARSGHIHKDKEVPPSYTDSDVAIYKRLAAQGDRLAQWHCDQIAKRIAWELSDAGRRAAERERQERAAWDALHTMHDRLSE